MHNTNPPPPPNPPPSSKKKSKRISQLVFCKTCFRCPTQICISQHSLRGCYICLSDIGIYDSYVHRYILSLLTRQASEYTFFTLIHICNNALNNVLHYLHDISYTVFFLFFFLSELFYCFRYNLTDRFFGQGSF